MYLLSLSLTTESGPLLLETRFGSFGSALFDTTSIATNTGAANSALAGMSTQCCYFIFPSNVCSGNSWCSRNWNDDYDNLCTFDTFYCWINGRKNSRVYEHED